MGLNVEGRCGFLPQMGESPEQNAWGSLGDLLLRADESPDAIRVKQGQKIARIPRIVGKDLLQPLGAENLEITLTFSFQIGWCNPDEKLSQLQAMMAAERPAVFCAGLRSV